MESAWMVLDASGAYVKTTGEASDANTVCKRQTQYIFDPEARNRIDRNQYLNQSSAWGLSQTVRMGVIL